MQLSSKLPKVGTTIFTVMVLPPGVYVAMNGRHFPWNAVRKNRATGSFEAADE